MRRQPREDLEARGFKETTVGEWLELTPEQIEMIELRVALATKLRRMREGRKMTQSDLARRIGTSQPRISKMESGDSNALLWTTSPSLRKKLSYMPGLITCSRSKSV